MSQNPADGSGLPGLVPARRNRYYYGKLMDVLHFSMEQHYGLAKQRLLNRAVLGPGVVRGLGVQPDPDGTGLVVGAGLAIDGWGREIIVPQDIHLSPLTLTDNGGPPPPNTQATVQICYQECETDFGPALVSEPGCGDGGCEAGTWVESYCVRVVSGAAPPVIQPPCSDAVLADLRAGNLQAAMCGLSQPWSAAPPDPWLALANVTVGATNATLTVDSCTPRLIVPTNQLLAQLVSCLARCCAGSSELLQVTDVSVYELIGPDPSGGNIRLLGRLVPPSATIEVPRQSTPNLIEVTFNAVPFDRNSVGGATVTFSPSGDIQFIIPQSGNAFRLLKPQGFGRPPLTVTLVGGPNGPAGSGAAAITAHGGGSRLDGEFPTSQGSPWHSGDGVEGGDFTFGVGFQAASPRKTPSGATRSRRGGAQGPQASSAGGAE